MGSKRKTRCLLSILLALTMIFNLNAFTALTNVNAADGYDIILTRVGAYYENGTAKVYADYRNVGNIKFNGEFDMYFYIDGKKVGNIGKAVGDNGTVTVTLSNSEQFSGTHAITAAAHVNDANTSNNNRTSYRRIESAEPTTKAPETTTQRPTAAPTTQAPTTTKAPETTTKAPETTTQRPTAAPTTQPQNTEAKVVAMGYPAEMEENQNIKITAVIQNTGNTDLPAGTPVTISVDGRVIATVNTTKVTHPGEYVGVDTSWAATFGGHTFTATLNNSSVTRRVNVTEAINRTTNGSTQGQRDVYVTDIGWFNVTTGVKNGPINVNDKVQFIAYTKNIGTLATPSVKHGVVFSFNGSEWGGTGVTWNDTFYGPLQPGESVEQQANGGGRDRYTDGCWIAQNGTCEIAALSNDGNTIDNENTGNNRTPININIPYRTDVRFNDNVDDPDPVDYILNHDELGEISGLQVVKAYKSSIRLSWQAAPGATGYNIYDGQGNYIGTTVSTDYSISGTFEVGRNYTYTVKAVQTILEYTKESNGKSVTATPQDGTQVVAYPVPAGFNASNGITMTANGDNVGVFTTRVSNVHYYPGAGWKSGETSNVAIFDYEGGEAEVKITVNRTDINYVDVKPKSDNISASVQRSGNSTIITMKLPDGKQGQYDLEMNGSAHSNDTIFVFAQEIMKKPDKVDRVIKKGQLVTGHIEVPDGQTYYIEGGGTIQGYVHLGNKSKLIGRGIIAQNNESGGWNYSNRNNPLSIGKEPEKSYGKKAGEGKSNVEVEGITILDPVGWAFNIRNSNDVKIKDVNIITASGNGDGITIQSSYDIDVEGCFVRSMDDSLVIKNYDYINSHNIKFSNCVIWTDLAQSMEIGYETDMGGVGAREEAGVKNDDPRIYNVLFNDIDVIHNFHKDVMSIHNANEVPVYHIGYKDIRVEQHSGGVFANGDDYGEFGNYNWNKGNYGPWAKDVQFDNVYGYQSSWGAQTSINPNTFFQ